MTTKYKNKNQKTLDIFYGKPYLWDFTYNRNNVYLKIVSSLFLTSQNGFITLFFCTLKWSWYIEYICKSHIALTFLSLKTTVNLLLLRNNHVKDIQEIFFIPFHRNSWLTNGTYKIRQLDLLIFSFGTFNSFLANLGRNQVYGVRGRRFRIQ